MAQIEVPDEIAARLKAATEALVTGGAPTAAATAAPADGSVIPDANPMAVAPEDYQKALDSSAAWSNETRQAVPGLTDLVGPTDPFEIAVQKTNEQIAQRQQEASTKANADGGVVGQTADAVNRVGFGILQAGDQTVRFFGDMIGNPDIGLGGVSDAINRDAKELDRRSGINAFLGGTAQFVTGLLGVGKIMGMTKIGRAAMEGSAVVKGVTGVAQGMVAAAVVMDPHSARLSDFIEQYPALQNPVTGYLASDPTDSIAEARFKNALEGAGMDVVVAGVFGAAVKVFSIGKRVEAGTLPAERLAEAEQQLQTAVQEAKAPGSTVATPIDPSQPVTMGGSEARVLPTTPNLLNQEATKALPTEQSVQDMAQGTAPRDPQAEAIATTIKGDAIDPNAGKIPARTEPNLINSEASAAGKTLTPTTSAEPQVRTGVGGAVADEAKAAGIPLRRQPGAAELERTLSSKPKIETNGIKYTMLSQDEMTNVGKAYGVDSSNWLGAGHRDTGEIYISEKVLALPPAQQARIIAHETGHVLEKQFVEAVTGQRGSFRILEKSIRDEMKAASQQMRGEHWMILQKYMKQARAGSKTAAKKAAATGNYLNSEVELFADSFAIWKTDREVFQRVAPQMTKLFDEHFAPWIDHDFAAHAGDLDTLTKSVPTTPAAPTEGLTGAPKAKPGMYGDKVKAERTVEQYDPEAVVTTADAAEVARVAGNDAAAIKQHGSQQAAEDAGYRFGKANLPYQKLNTSDDVTAFLSQTAARFKAQLDEMKDGDVLSDPRVDAAIKQRVELFNEDPGTVMGQLQAAGRGANAMVANMEAAFTVANKAANDLEQLVKNNRMGNYAEFGGDANAAEAALAPRLALYLEALGAAQAMRSAVGRGMRRLRGDFILDEATLANVRKLLPEDVSRIVDMAGGNKKMLAKLAQQGFWERFKRGAGTLFANNLLWNWTSHARNLLGNTFMLASSPAIRAVGSFGLREGGQTVRVQALREYRYMLSAMGDAKDMAVTAYLKGDSALDPYNNEYLREATDQGKKQAGIQQLGLKPVNTVGDAWENISKSFWFLATQPTRVLGMADEFFKQTSYRGSVLAEASIKADELGLNGQAYKDYLQSELDKAFDASGRATNKDALYDAEVRTFSQPLLQGTYGNTIAGAVYKHPMSRFILPFVKAPVNLLRYAVKLTPGLNAAQAEYRQMFKGELGAKRQADAYGQIAMGGLLLGTGVSLAHAGMVTGGGPTDPVRLKALTDTGWKPYSIMTQNADGTKTYVPFNSMDPVGMTLSIVADLAQVQMMGDQGDAAIDKLILPAVMAVAKTIANRTYLRSLNDAMDAIGNPDAGASSWAGGLASGMVPFSSLLRTTNPDPLLRESRGILDRVLSGIQGFSDDIPPRRDYAGETILRTNGLVFTSHSTELADREQQRMLVAYGTGIVPLNAVQKGGVDLRQFKLASTGSTAFDRYQELISHPTGVELSLKEALGKLIATDGYARMSDAAGQAMPGTKLATLQSIVNKYREVAYGQLLRENPDLRAETAMQQQATREALSKGETVGVASQLRRANQAFGVQ